MKILEAHRLCKKIRIPIIDFIFIIKQSNIKQVFKVITTRQG